MARKSWNERVLDYLASIVGVAHVQGTDQGLDTGGANAVTAAQAKSAYTHSGSTGSPHTAAGVGADAAGTAAAAVSAHAATNNHPEATTEAKGMISSADKTKLDGIETAADVTDATNVAAALVGTVFSSAAQLEYPVTGSMVNDTPVSGKIIKEGTGTLVAGDLYYRAADGSWAQTDADAEATAGGMQVAIALGTSPTVDGLLVEGLIDADGALADHSPGKTLYISTTLGKITTTAPAGSGDVVRPIGSCLGTADEIEFKPSDTYIVLT